jgi:hypothetical protein
LILMPDFTFGIVVVAEPAFTAATYTPPPGV